MLKRRKFFQSERDFIAQRANGYCEYCQTPFDFSPESFQLEHIAPLAKGGTNELENIAFSCGGCNGRKSSKTQGIDPITNAEVSFFHPRLDIWKKYFDWIEDSTIIDGKTTVGRATIAVLDLNRNGLINLRKALILFGVHPPK